MAVQMAERMATDHRSVDPALVARLREVFSDAEVAELLMMIGQYIAMGRMLVVTGGHRAACEIYVPD